MSAQEDSFAKLWADRSPHCLVVDMSLAIKNDLLRFLPQEGEVPKRIRESEGSYNVSRPTPDVPVQPETANDIPGPSVEELRRLVWGIIRHAPALPNGGERVGEATAAVKPWPYQVRTFHRLYDNWPPKLLIADEVGLGKTIEAGMLLRQAWLSGRAKRILILAPKSVLSQWQIELREKFNLNWPIYDGQKLSWYPTRALGGNLVKQVPPDQWHQEPCVLTSSQLMRRRDRARVLLESAEPYDLVVLDEAHHARRRGAGGPGDYRPNQLLRLMQGIKDLTQSLILLTATPLQVHPVEVWDLLRLLGLPDEWTEEEFVRFFEDSVHPNPSHQSFESMARLFRAVESKLGETPLEEAQRLVRLIVPGAGNLATRRVLDALRDRAQTQRRQLDVERRKAAVKIMRANSPVSRLVSRHTRELLRGYFSSGKLETPIADRDVQDKFVEMSPAERAVYRAVEDYISTTYNQASAKERNAVGFIMTVYRKRVASSFSALTLTLSRRLQAMANPQLTLEIDDVEEDDFTEEALDLEEAQEMDRQVLMAEERSDIHELLDMAKVLPTDTKAGVLLRELQQLKADGYEQAMVFTQYTDTMDFLRDYLVNQYTKGVLCFSGRGGELRDIDGSWRVISRDETKRLFREGKAEILLCTDAAAEGLNFQFCGAVVNYEMPWNPMRVEQRIGRIDRLGQEHSTIRIVNLHYEDTVETDVYRALRKRIGLFSKFIGKLQPILARLPQTITNSTLSAKRTVEGRTSDVVTQLLEDVASAEGASFDLDEITASVLDESARPPALYDLSGLDRLLKHGELLPPGLIIKPMGSGEYEFSMPGMSQSMRITTNAAYFEEHPGSTELWSPGSPLFPDVGSAAPIEQVSSIKRRLVDVLDNSNPLK